MTFKDATKKLRALAKERYCSIRYEVSAPADGIDIPVCDLYITGIGWISGAVTWEIAFLNLEALLDGKKDNGEPEGAPL